ncbi:MAG: diguanylate cyclase, partial [Alphaproteobacteria bacterium]|nr:diguanylate cyclase [Alphaproteobacteria bacterium]
MTPGFGIRLSGKIPEASILVVEDDPTQRHILSAMLESMGAGKVHCAASAEEAFAIAGYPAAGPKTQGVDLILMDVILEDSNGIDLCRRLAALPGLTLVPIIIVTSLSDPTTLKSAFEAGAADFITKPIADYELEARISAALGWRRSMLIRIERESTLEKREEELIKVTEVLQQTNERLQLLSTRDALTGIANRRGLNDFLDMEWRRAAREHGCLSLVMIDVDDFKNFNDTQGHQAGDECLWMVALSLKDCLNRGADMVGRYGGEEF